MQNGVIGVARKKLFDIKQNIYLSRRYSEVIKKMNSSKREKRIYIFGIPEHGNLGDQAIAHAEIEYFKTQFDSYEVIEIPSKMVKLKLKPLKKYIKNEDIICLHGGGYLGTLWPDEEEMARSVIQNFPNNKIIVLPQTIFYSNSKLAQKSLKLSIEIYNGHSNLHLCAREKKTYNAFKQYYPKANIVLVPDIVLYLNKSESTLNRKGVLACFRTDKESSIDNEIKKTVKKIINKMNMDLSYTDTTVKRSITKDSRISELEKKFDEFKSSELVVTDRLHGMIFSAITGTPCVALNNKSGKVKGVYFWIKELKYIQFVDNSNNLENAIRNVTNSKNNKYSNQEIKSNYQPLAEIVRM